jgi:hypothetical protein
VTYFDFPSVTIPAITENNGELTTWLNISKKHCTKININKLVMVRNGRAFTVMQVLLLFLLYPLLYTHTHTHKNSNLGMYESQIFKTGDKKKISCSDGDFPASRPWAFPDAYFYFLQLHTNYPIRIIMDLFANEIIPSLPCSVYSTCLYFFDI